MNHASPFDVAKAFYDDAHWKEISQYDKKQAYFILNRMLSKEHPGWANAFNHRKSDPVGVIEFWRAHMHKMYTRAPQHMYVSGKQPKENPQENRWSLITEETLRAYARNHQLGTRDIQAYIDSEDDAFFGKLRDFQNHRTRSEKSSPF